MRTNGRGSATRFNLCCIRISFEQRTRRRSTALKAGFNLCCIRISFEHDTASYDKHEQKVSIFVVLEFLSNTRTTSRQHYAKTSFNLCCIRISFEPPLRSPRRCRHNVSIFVVLEFLSNPRLQTLIWPCREVSIFVVLEFLSNHGKFLVLSCVERFNLCCIRISFEHSANQNSQQDLAVSIFVVLEFLSNLVLVILLVPSIPFQSLLY